MFVLHLWLVCVCQHVNITNFTTSWNDGMAFCALIHRFRPNSFDYDKLDPANRRYNFQLAFDTAEYVHLSTHTLIPMALLPLPQVGRVML